jgi:hypothetical protein
MTTETCSRLLPGTVVRTTQPNLAKRKEWTDAGWMARKWGVIGTITAHHDSHGLYYDVEDEDGRVAGYDPSEIVALESYEILVKANELASAYGLKAELLSDDAFSVGVQGDQRTYTPVITLVGPWPGNVALRRLSTEICNTVKVNRVTYTVDHD